MRKGKFKLKIFNNKIIVFYYFSELFQQNANEIKWENKKLSKHELILNEYCSTLVDNCVHKYYNTT